ncbi:MAG: shikimate dehydrogenase [Bacteroidetes bacterium]|nr:shikimate dehydrogenase [Bacteroidota bacterium]
MPAEYGLIGYPLGHSFSPEYFAKKFADLHIDARYELYPLASISELESLLHSQPLKGLNVTIPYKKQVIPYLDKLDEVAERVGAVNTISFRDGIKTGYNTDVIGFAQSLVPLLKQQHREALVLGTGGASKAVAYVLENLGISYTKVSRSKTESVLQYEELDEGTIAANKLIINCTPLGKYPNAEQAPKIPYDGIGESHLLYDLIYNPSETKFLQLGKERGAVIKNGLEMLQLQADAAWEIWNR